jgi:spermidine synthase
VLYAAEGSRTDIRVTQDQTDVTLLLNGVPVSGLGTNVAPELAMAYIPRFLHPEAKRVLVAGYGSGAAAGASLLFPGTSVLCSEPESAMFTMAKGFSSANHLAVKTSSSLSLGEPDTRALMRSHPASFDLILVNYLDTRLPNVRDFLTAQALRDARVALAPKGILALRLCVPSFTPADAALAVRTVLAAFPHAVWVRLTARDSLLLASSQPIEPAPASVATAQNFVQTQPAIQSDLRQILNTSSVASLFFQTLWLDETGLRQLGAYQSSDSVATDWSPKYNQGGLTARAAVDQPPGLLDQEIATASSHGWFEINFARCGLGPADAALFHKIALRLKENGQINTALKLVRWGLQIAPEEPYLLADEAILSGENDPKLFESIGSRVAKGSVDAANRLGVNLWASGQYDLAVVVFQKIVEVCPTSATAWHNLASNYRHGGHADLAAPLLAKAAALDPANDATSQLPVDGFAPPPSPNSPSSTGRSKPNE